MQPHPSHKKGIWLVIQIPFFFVPPPFVHHFLFLIGAQDRITDDPTGLDLIGKLVTSPSMHSPRPAGLPIYRFGAGRLVLFWIKWDAWQPLLLTASSLICEGRSVGSDGAVALCDLLQKVGEQDGDSLITQDVLSRWEEQGKRMAAETKGVSVHLCANRGWHKGSAVSASPGCGGQGSTKML